MSRRSSHRTLLTSLVLSAPGPVVVGLGLLVGRSSTQLADFIRRSAELIAIVVAWAVFRALHRGPDLDPVRRQQLETAARTAVGAALCVSGSAILLVALLTSTPEKGNVLPGLVIALLGVTTNTWFWLRYRALDRETPHIVLASQRNLYRAKSLVDACVSVALLTVTIAPGTPAAHLLDVAGSVAVALYLILTGLRELGPRPTVRPVANPAPTPGSAADPDQDAAGAGR